MGMLEGERAVVTGGGSGGGGGAGRRRVGGGGAGAGVGSDAEATARTAAELDVRPFVADVSAPDACTAAITGAAEALGGLTVLFNNAGVGSAMPLHKYPDAEWSRLVGVNL